MADEAFGTTYSLRKPPNPETTYSSTFNEKSIEESDTKKMNKYAKFVSLFVCILLFIRSDIVFFAT